MFDVAYSNQARKFLCKADKTLLRRMTDKIEELRKEPVIPGTKRIIGYKEKLFRVRLGDYRILYEIDYANAKIGIVKIDERGRVYR